jgi:Mn2+/Fe2+ NRAMP family transporter
LREFKPALQNYSSAHVYCSSSQTDFQRERASVQFISSQANNESTEKGTNMNTTNTKIAAAVATLVANAVLAVAVVGLFGDNHSSDQPNNAPSQVAKVETITIVAKRA